MEVKLTEEQQVAVDAAVDCLNGETSENITIGGLAGTGKTTLIKSILDEMRALGKYVAVVAFAGKAVSVLRQKGVYQAQTLHSLIYKPDKKDGKLTFTRVFDLDCDAVIVDEASMINTALYEDLLSFDKPVVFIGDHGQLEPIGDNPGLMENPHFRLEKIHRQAEGSAILWLAHLFREGKKPNWASVPADAEIRQVPKKEVASVAHTYDVVVCGYNKTRRVVNSIVRESRGYQSELVVGERLICLKNTRTGFFNGMMFTIEKIHDKKSQFTANGPLDIFVVDLKSDDGAARTNVSIWLAKGEQPDLRDFPNEIVACDYGYALTAHKIQGSQFDKVLVLEEIWTAKWNPSRWKYTCATRAAKELGWVNP